MSYLALIVLTLIIGVISSGWVNSALKKYAGVANSTGTTGSSAARQMLSFYGISSVEVKMGSEGQDFFDPRSNSITLSPSAYNGRTVTAVATACHEVGHACQYAADYTPMKVRTSIVPVVNLASNAWVFILIIGIMLNISGLTTLAIVLYAIVVIFQLVTLPVEFDASNRALKYMDTIAMSEADQTGSAKVLRACAFTYVAAALSSILQLLYLLGRADRN